MNLDELLGWAALTVNAVAMKFRQKLNVIGCTLTDRPELNQHDVAVPQGSSVVGSGTVYVRGSGGAPVVDPNYEPGDVVKFMLADANESTRTWMPYAIPGFVGAHSFTVIADSTDLGFYYYKIIR